MAAAFDRAGFEALDVHMSDILAGRRSLADFGLRRVRRLLVRRRAGRRRGLGQVDPVQRAGARRVRGVLRARRHVRARRLQRLPDDGNLHEIIPGTAHWPHFVRNRSEQFEARFALVEVQRSPSLFFRGMDGSRIPIATRTARATPSSAMRRSCAAARAARRAALRRQRGQPTERYPANPNGSPQASPGSPPPTAASRS